MFALPDDGSGQAERGKQAYQVLNEILEGQLQPKEEVPKDDDQLNDEDWGAELMMKTLTATNQMAKMRWMT